jgi:hypothetical protein
MRTVKLAVSKDTSVMLTEVLLIARARGDLQGIGVQEIRADMFATAVRNWAMAELGPARVREIEMQTDREWRSQMKRELEARS